jgi:predicted acetyltransferase
MKRVTMHFMYEIRKASEEDRESTVHMLTVALSEVEGFEESWIESWEKYWNRPENEDWAVVATMDGKVISNVAYFANEFNVIKGSPIRYGGVWAVATDKVHRRKGLLKNLLTNAFRDMKDKGIVLSILNPSTYDGAQIAYEKCGYVLAESRVKHNIPPNILVNVEGPEDIDVKELEDDERKTISELERSMVRFGSRAFTWQFFYSSAIQSGNFFLFERESEPVGCVKLTIDKTDSDNILRVSFAYFKSFEVLPSIINLIAKNSTNATTIEWSCSPQIPIELYVHNIHKINTKVAGSMMMRVVNFENLCNSIRVTENATDDLVLKIIDKYCPWNTGTYKLAVSNSKLKAERIDEHENPDVTLDSKQLSRVVCGLTPKHVLQQLGVISCSPETAMNLDAIFPYDEFYSNFRF